MRREKIPPVKRDLHVPPIAVTVSGVVINGHARVAAAQQAGITEMPAVVLKHPDVRFHQEVAK